MTGDQIRQRFLDFFQAHEHRVLASARLVPDDPTTHFTTAGMQPFVPYFLGNEEPPSRRIATCQKCLRADDLDEVGYTARHLSFFEMLGNFSFGDYFKKEAIAWGWEFVRQGLELDPDVLWVSVYEDDDEAAEIWHKHVGVAKDRIVRFGMDDNWWGPVGNSGPCGPCSEIFLDRGPKWGSAGSPVEDEGGDRFVELWNLVFQQYNSSMSKAELKATGTIPQPLPAPGIDTGAGLERVAAAMQGVATVFETDLLKPICDAVIGLARERGKGDIAYGDDREDTAAVNRIADHVRALSFAISDGMFPSNKAGGYVLRQILRRAARFGRLRLGLSEPFVHELVATVADRFGDVYPEVRESQAHAAATIRQEEERFSDTLNTGIPRLEEALGELHADGGGVLGGEKAFHLYETYGVPIEVQQEVAAERGFRIDTEGFERVRSNRERRAMGAEGHGEFGDDLLSGIAPTEFVGYDATETEAEIVAIIRSGELDETRGLVTRGERVEQASAGDDVILVLDRTPFYAESGGQVGDIGRINVDAKVHVGNTRKDKNGRWLHFAEVQGGDIEVGAKVSASIDCPRRDRIRRAHTATHLLHAALRGRLGDHVAQAGSLVDGDRLRFDFSHPGSLSAEDVAAIERQVNEWILGNHPIDIQEVPIDEARKLGAMMFFGEKYGQTVRVVNVGETLDREQRVSMELCGGTHVARTGDIGQMRLIGESSVGSGIRRVEALTGTAALDYAREHEARLREVAGAVRAPVGELLDRVQGLQGQVRELERALALVQQQQAAGLVDRLVGAAEDKAGVPIVATTVNDLDADAVKTLADDIGDRLQEGVVLLGANVGGKVLLVCKASDAAVGRGAHAGNIVRAAAQAVGGGGGGRPQFAQAGGKDVDNLPAAIAAGLEVLGRELG